MTLQEDTEGYNYTTPIRYTVLCFSSALEDAKKQCRLYFLRKQHK